MELKVGSTVDGRITGVKHFGAFVLLPEGTTGLVHISEVSNDYIHELADVLTEGQNVKVKILSINPEDGKVALSMKQTKERPVRSTRADNGRVWQPKQTQSNDNLSFEDMMSRYKTQSEEKISDLRRVTEARRGGGYSRRR